MSAVLQAAHTLSDALSLLVMAVIALLSYRAGRRKTVADGDIARANARKAIAEAEEAETRASLDSIAGGLNDRLDSIQEQVSSGMDLLANQIHGLQDEVGHIKHEVTPNHGGSIKDAVRRIEDQQRVDHELAAQRAQETTTALALLAETQQTSQEVAARDRSRLWGEIEHLKSSVNIPR